MSEYKIDFKILKEDLSKINDFFLGLLMIIIPFEKLSKENSKNAVSNLQMNPESNIIANMLISIPEKYKYKKLDNDIDLCRYIYNLCFSYKNLIYDFKHLEDVKNDKIFYMKLTEVLINLFYPLKNFYDLLCLKTLSNIENPLISITDKHLKTLISYITLISKLSVGI